MLVKGPQEAGERWNIITRGTHKACTLTHCGRVTHICICKLIIIGSDNGLSPGRRPAIIWTNAGILSIGPLGTNFSEISIEIHTFPFKKMHLKMSSAKWRLFRFFLNELNSQKAPHISLWCVWWEIYVVNILCEHNPSLVKIHVAISWTKNQIRSQFCTSHKS